MSCDGSPPARRVVARLDGVWKKYRLQHERPSTVRERLTNLFRRPDAGEEFWALRGVSLEVHAGETVGIIGGNGSGKTTILKLLAGITAGTKGRVEVAGRCGALIELGAGFHPELSGRENIFLNGAILGLSRTELKRRYAGIVDFAELEHFIDTPVKYYSSGMGVRLGFAIAVSVDADLLLVDEGLSVGDHSFQEKSLRRVVEMQKEGRSFVVVSHSMDMLSKVCHRVVWIDRGVVRAEGDPDTVIGSYAPEPAKSTQRAASAGGERMTSEARGD